MRVDKMKTEIIDIKARRYNLNITGGINKE